MLVHAIVLSALLSVSVSVACYLVTGDLGRVVQCIGLTWAGISLVCFRAQWLIADAHLRGRIARATYHPIPPTTHIIEHLPERTPELPAPAPVAKPVERIRFIPLATNYRAKFQSTAIASPVLRESHEPRYGVSPADLAWFIRGLTTPGSHSRRKWEGRVTPSGATVDTELYARLILPLVQCGAIVGRAERRAGTLVMSSDEILVALELD